MDLQFFAANRFSPALFIPQIKKEWKGYFEWKAFRQYDPMFHEILSKYKRKDKIIYLPAPNGDCNPTTGDPVLEPHIVKLNRIPVPIQKLIVSRGSAFLTGGKVTLKANPEGETEQKLYDAVKTTWRKNKLQFKNSAIATAFMSETECAEIWYSDIEGSVNKKGVLKCKIYQPSKGFELTPVFDAMGDLIAFGLGYEDTVDGKKVKKYDVYDDEYISYHINDGGEWRDYKPKLKHPYGKIPVIYYSLEKAIWADVQWCIDRLEYLISNFSDNNDYNSSPILFSKGEITGFSSKGEQGRVIEGTKDSELSYVGWEHAPEAIKLEKDMLLEFIFTMTQTPNISFSEMKGLGDISGAAFDRMMIDGHLKATDLQNGMFGEMIQRRLNFLCYACAWAYDLDSAKDMEISPEFSLFRIDSLADRITIAQSANGGLPVLDQEASIALTGLTDNAEETYRKIQEQSTNTQNNNPAN